MNATLHPMAPSAHNPPMQGSDLGLIGLGVMGENLALNFARNGFSVCGFDANAGKREQFARRTQGSDAAASISASASASTSAAPDLRTLVANLKRPRRILMMVPAGAAVDAVIGDLAGLLEPGDVLIDGGNTHYLDTQRRLQALQAQGVLYVGMGVSGGEQGALRGPALMPGGDPRAWPIVQPLLQQIAARADDGQPCCDWIGTEGSGHFVKMVHNGIEYADMQLICEAYALMRQVLGLAPKQMAPVFRRWNEGALGSYLIQITADILERDDPHTGQALVDQILDTAEQKGTGKWTSQIALDLGTPVPTIAQSVFARSISALHAERARASGVLAGASAQPAADRTALITQLEGALLAARICAYAQGMSLLRAADAEYRWGLSLSAIASVWRAGCIIRARLLEDIRQAFARDPALPNLLMDGAVATRVSHAQQPLREVVALGALHGIALPALMSALAYYDGYRSQRLPANLMQAQRDYFGAHGYQRIDRPGKFHTHWQE